MKTLRTISLLIFTGFIFLIYQNIMAFRTGIVGFTKKDGNMTGCVCHGLEPTDSISVIISGPSSVHAGDSAIYTLSISNGPAIAGGCDISSSLGEVYTSSLDTNLKREEPFSGAGFELTHKEPVLFKGDTVRFKFKYIAPSTPNVTDTIFANGNSADNSISSEGDYWNYADNFTVNITPPIGIANNNNLISSYRLEQNFPNPFNPETKIQFTINKSSVLSLSVYDINGREVAQLLNNKQYSAGKYSVTLNAAQFGLTSGVYFYKLTTDTRDNSGNFSDVKKMMIIK